LNLAKVWLLAKGSLRALTKLPAYFGDGDGALDSLANVAIALRRFPESVAYQLCFGRLPNYMNPETHSEKIQWRKLFDRRAQLVTFSDKLAARKVAVERAPRIRLPKLLWEGGDPDSIPFGALTPPYVVKVVNRAGAVIFVRTPEDVNEDQIRETCRYWMKAPPHGRRVYEWAYGRVAPRFYIEEFLFRPGSDLPPPDLKVFVFGGEVRYIYQRDIYMKRWGVFSTDWERHDWDRWERGVVTSRNHYNADVPKPEKLGEIIAAAKQIAADMDYLRVDLYEIGDALYFGETTVYPFRGNAGWISHDAVCDPNPPDDVDREMGAHWQLPEISRKAKVRLGLLG
jgi:hypothetical protein